MLLVDTCVLVDVLQGDPVWAPWSMAQLRAQAHLHPLGINPVIYAELSHSFNTIHEVDQTVDKLKLQLLEIPRPALFLAGRAYLQYRKRGGIRQGVLPDFFIGAHATVQGWPLLTRDAARFRTYFPTLEVLAPGPLQ